MLTLVPIGKCHNPRQLHARQGLLLTNVGQAQRNQNKTKELKI